MFGYGRQDVRELNYSYGCGKDRTAIEHLIQEKGFKGFLPRTGRAGEQIRRASVELVKWMHDHIPGFPGGIPVFPHQFGPCQLIILSRHASEPHYFPTKSSWSKLNLTKSFPRLQAVAVCLYFLLYSLTKPPEPRGSFCFFLRLPYIVISELVYCRLILSSQL